MIGLFCFVLAVLASPFKSKLRLEAENAVLRHQLIVLRRRLHGRVRLTNHDRWFFIQLYRWFPSILKVLTIIRPETLVRWASGRLSLLLALEVAALSDSYSLGWCGGLLASCNRSRRTEMETVSHQSPANTADEGCVARRVRPGLLRYVLRHRIR
jgi:hypothetical protein